MNILFNIIGVDPPFNPRHGGAIGKLVGYQIDYLQKKGHKVIALVDKESNFKKEGINIIFYSGKSSCDNVIEFVVYGFLQFIKISKVNADIIISVHPRNIVSSFFYSKFSKKKWMAWELDHIFWVRPINRVKLVYHLMIKFSSKIFSISSQQKRWILERGIHRDKVELVYDCIDTDRFCPSDIINRENYILYVAKFTERKNHIALINAFKNIIDNGNFPNLNLFLVGSKSGIFTQRDKVNSSFYYLQCQSLVEKNGLNKRVSFFDIINEDELIELYRKCELFVMPSLEEGFGLTLLEAMSCGCVCIASNIEPLPEVLSDSGYLVKPLDINELTERIRFLLNNDKERERLGVLARQRAIKMFSHKRIREIFENQLLKT